MTTSTTPPISFGTRVKNWARENRWMLVFVSAVIITRAFLVNHYTVPSGSMQPILQPGDQVVVDMRAYGLSLPFSDRTLVQFASPSRGDVILFFSPKDGTRLVKRVAAIAGDEVSVIDGRLKINGQTLAEGQGIERIGSYRVTLDLNEGPGPDFGPVRVPEGKLLVLGDHRGLSFDGRFFGWVDANAVYGRALGIAWRGGPAWHTLRPLANDTEAR